MIKKFYDSSPIWIQNFACTFKGFIEKQKRFGGDFNEIYEFLKESEWKSFNEIKEYKNLNLNKIINYCFYNIPYYNEVMRLNKLVPSDIKTEDDLNKLPILTKELVRLNYDKLKNTNFKGKVFKLHTSGSTGKALSFNFSLDAIRYRWALWSRHKARFGISPFDSYATFTGQVAIPLSQSNPPFWRENFAMNQTIFTMHHINNHTVKSIVNKLNQGGYTYYSGYPSILYSLANLIEENYLEIFSPPKVIFTGAEALLDTQKNKIEKIFNCVVTDQYGFSEGCGNASKCEHGIFHEDFEYGILECNNSFQIDNNLRTGEVLATGFTNLAMPFIRYQVGDTATWDENLVCDCGRKSNVLTRINGRNEDYVITPEGNKILRFDYIFKDTYNINEAQVIQNKLGEITINIVKRANYKLKEELKIEKLVHSKISENLIVNFQYLKEIPREASGKFRAVKSNLK